MVVSLLRDCDGDGDGDGDDRTACDGDGGQCTAEDGDKASVSRSFEFASLIFIFAFALREPARRGDRGIPQRPRRSQSCARYAATRPCHSPSTRSTMPSLPALDQPCHLFQHSPNHAISSSTRPSIHLSPRRVESVPGTRHPGRRLRPVGSVRPTRDHHAERMARGDCVAGLCCPQSRSFSANLEIGLCLCVQGRLVTKMVGSEIGSSLYVLLSFESCSVHLNAERLILRVFSQLRSKHSP